jgi:hypothetical protein
MQKLRDERNELKIALKQYGDHTAACPAIVTGDCTCGWRAIKARHGIR